MALAVAQTVLMVNDTSSATTYTSGTTITPAGSTLVVALISGCSDTSGSTPSISSITLGGVAMTVQGAIQDVAGGRNWTAIATLNNAAASASSISITMAALNRAMRIRCVEVTGHDTTSPIAQSFGASQNSNVTTITQTASVINAGAMFLGCVGVQSGTANTTIIANDAETILATSGRTGSTGFSDISGQGAWEIHAATGSQTFGFDWTGANYATLKVIEIKPAAGGGVSVTPGSGTVSVQGASPTATAGVNAFPGTGSVAVQGFAPTVSVGSSVSVTAGNGSIDVQGFAPVVGIGASATAGAGSVAVQGFAPTVSAGVSVTTGQGSVAVQGFSPTASAGGSVSVTAGVGSVTVQGFAPSVSAGVTITCGAGVLDIQGFAPSVATGAGVSVTAGVGTLSVQGFAPTASASASITLGAGSMSVQGFAPTASAGVTITCGMASVTVQGFAPVAGVVTLESRFAYPDASANSGTVNLSLNSLRAG